MTSSKTKTSMFQWAGIPDIAGLSAEQAAAILGEDGFNELPSSRPRSFLAIAFSVAREPMNARLADREFPGHFVDRSATLASTAITTCFGV